MKHFVLTLSLILTGFLSAEAQIAGALQSYNDGKQDEARVQQYFPEGDAIVCVNGKNRFTRALYGSYSDWRVETSDRPVFAVVKKNHHRHIRFEVNGVALDSTDYCKASYVNGMRIYRLQDKRWGKDANLKLTVVAMPDREGAVWLFDDQHFDKEAVYTAEVCDIANPKLSRNGDIGADKPGCFEASSKKRNISGCKWNGGRETYFVIDSINQITPVSDEQGRQLFMKAVMHNGALQSRIEFNTPDAYINTLGSALTFAADGDWDGQTWLHGCIGWRMPLAGWRAAYVGDVLGWNERQLSHFNAYAKSQVTNVEPTIPHPSQDAKMNMARAEKKWGTQMYSNGYICRNPERNNQMHHYDRCGLLSKDIWRGRNATTTPMVITSMMPIAASGPVMPYIIVVVP